MSNIKEKLKKLFSNKNFVRAAVIYVTSLLIGVVGFLVFRGDVGWWFITCSPGFGTGIALALLNNGHKKPVTFKSIASTVVMTLLLAAIMYFLKAPLLSLAVGWVLNMVGAALALWWCRIEAGSVGIAKEIIDIFDADMNKIGEMEKWEAHEKHQWHKNAHIWVTDGRNVLVQLRAPDKKTFPNKWDISSAGHFVSGDIPLQCAKREWSEELGLPWEFGEVEPDLMKAWGMWDEQHVYEYIYFFFLKDEIDISKAELQKEEVAELKWIKWEEFLQQIKTDSFCPYGDEYWDIVVKGLGKLIDKPESGE